MNHKDREISIESLLVRVLLRWKQLIICGVIFALLGGGFSFAKQKSQISNENKSTTKTTEESSAYAEYYENQQEELKKVLTERYEYMNNTLVSDLNPYSSCVAELTLYVRSTNGNDETIAGTNVQTDSDDNEDDSTVVSSDANTNTILTTLDNFVKYGIDWDDLKDDFKVNDNVYLNELIVTQVSGDVFTVTIFYKNKKGANKLLDNVYTQIQEKFNSIVSTAGISGYSLIELDHNVSNVIYGDNFNWLHNRINEINNYISDSQDASTYSNQASSLYNSKSGPTSISKKKILKFMIVFGVFGTLLNILIIIVFLLGSGRVLSAKEMNNYFEMNNLAILPKKFKNKEIKGLNEKIVKINPEDRSKLTFDNRLEIAAESLHNQTGKKVAVIGDISVSDLESISNGLRKYCKDVDFVILSNVIESIIDRKQLSLVDSVILVGETEVSTYAHLDELVSIINNYKKEILGTICC